MNNQKIKESLSLLMDLHQPQEITLPDGSYGTCCRLCNGWSYPCDSGLQIIRIVKEVISE